MRIDSIAAKLLSNFFLDIAKAIFIASFIAPSASKISSPLEFFLSLTRGLLSVSMYLSLAWLFARKRKDEQHKLD